MLWGSVPAVPALAEEIDETESGIIIDDETDYLDSCMRLSFGQHLSTDKVDFQKAEFTNIGQFSHYYTISVSPADMWEVDIPEFTAIDPGVPVEIYVRPNMSNPNWTEGEHTGVLTMSGYSVTSGTISDTVSVNLYMTIYKESEPWVSSVSVSPSSMALSKDTNYTFSADVICGDGADSTVEWSVIGQNSNSTYIDNNGTLYVGKDETASLINVRATSVQDRSKNSTASVGITKSQYTINTLASPSKGGSTAGGGVYEDGQPAKVIANPANGYTFAGWYDSNNKLVSSEANYTFIVDSSQALTAKFSQNSVRVKTSKNLEKAGNVSDGATINYGGNYTATATVNTGYKFVGWYEGDKLISNGTTVTISGITSNRELLAVYEHISYEVVAVVNPAGTGTISGTGRYDKGSKVTLTANPIQGYSVEAWIINNQVVGNGKTLTIDKIDKDYSITVLFKQDSVQVTTYTIGASTDSSNGTVTPAGNTNIPEGKTLTISIVPNKNYRVSDVKIDGKSVGAISTYTFYDVRSNHTLVASFAQVEATPAKTTQTSEVKSDHPQQQNKTEQSSTTTSTETTPAENSTPQDEATQASEACELTELTGTLQDLNITQGEAREYIRAGEDRALMEDALYRGDLQVTVVNSYAEDVNETATASYYEITSIPNIEDVIDALLSEDEKISLFEGNKIRANLNICQVSSVEIPEDEMAIFDKQTSDIAIDDFFDIRFITEVDGVPHLVTNLNVPMKVIMKVSPEMKANGSGRYCVLRVHNGEFDILEDLDNDTDTVTFVTDKMSTFALAYYNGGNSIDAQSGTSDNTLSKKNDNTSLVIIIMTGVIVIGVVIIAAVAISSGKKSRKKKKHKR